MLTPVRVRRAFCLSASTRWLPVAVLTGAGSRIALGSERCSPTAALSLLLDGRVPRPSRKAGRPGTGKSEAVFREWSCGQRGRSTPPAIADGGFEINAGG
jgi:hypothetical protein